MNDFFASEMVNENGNKTYSKNEQPQQGVQ